MFDVLVIGSGLAGTIAAFTAQGQGARVALASRSWGATAMSTGAIHIASTPALSPAHQTPRTVAEHAMDIIAHRKRHPYGILGLERTFAGLRGGYEILRDILEPTQLAIDGLDLEAENVGFPSALGTVIPAASAFAPHRGIDLSRPLAGPWGVLQLLGDGSFDSRRIKLGLQRDARDLCGTEAELVEIPLTLPAASAVAVARSFDDQEQVAAAARELRTKVGGLAGLIAPPVLGIERSTAARQQLSEAIGAPVVEVLSHLPSVPGIRLQQCLDRAILQCGVAPVGEVRGPLCDGSTLRGIITTDQLEISAGAVVLATGRFIAGGITWNGECRETLFGLPVVTELGPMEDDGPLPVVRESPVESHPLMTAGVWIDENLRPMREGRVAYDNLFAAGMVIGGFASRYVLCADGVALATGWLAGKAAAA